MIRFAAETAASSERSALNVAPDSRTFCSARPRDRPARTRADRNQHLISNGCAGEKRGRGKQLESSRSPAKFLRAVVTREQKINRKKDSPSSRITFALLLVAMHRARLHLADVRRLDCAPKSRTRQRQSAFRRHTPSDSNPHVSPAWYSWCTKKYG